MKRFVALLVVVIVVCAAWTGGWYYVAGELRAAVASLGEADGETAPQVTCEGLAVTGFPFRFDLECTGATLVDGDTTVTLAGLKGSARVYGLNHVVLSGLGPATVTDAFTGSQSRVDFAAAQGSIRLETPDLLKGLQGEGWRIGRVALVMDDVRWTDTLVGETVLATSSHIDAQIMDMPEQLDVAAGRSALATYAVIDDLAAPGMLVADGKVTLEAELTGLPSDLRDFGVPDLLARWRAAGGTLKVLGLRAVAGDESFEGSGEVKLDDGARLEGQIVVAHKGLVERAGPLIPEDIKPWLLGGQAEDGSYKQTLTMRAGLVFSGLLPVGTLAPLF